MLSFRPLSSRVFLHLLRTSLKAQAREIIEIAPATSREVRLAVALPDEVHRVIQICNQPDLTALRQLQNPILEQGSAFAYRVDDALIADGSVLLPYACAYFQATKRRWKIGGNPEIFEEAALCTSNVIEQYFGHWLLDGLSQELLAQDRGLTPLTFQPKPKRFHELGYRTLLGMTTRQVADARVKRLWVFEDWEITDHRVARMRRLRERLNNCLSTKVNIKTYKRVFIARGVQGVARQLVNENEVINALSARGFTILSPEHESPDVIAAHLNVASMVVSVEGSAFSHAIMAGPPNIGIFVIQPPKRFSTMWKTYCDVLDMHFGFTVADPVGDQSFSQPIDRLLRGIDLFETAISKV